MGTRMRCGCAAVAAAVLLAGCGAGPRRAAPAAGVGDSGVQGAVDMQLLEAAAAQRYAPEPGVTYEQPAPLPDNPLPAYPPDQLPRRLPAQRVAVRVAVDSQGRVTQVQPLPLSPAPEPAFVAAVIGTLQQWMYFPLVRIAPGAPGALTLGNVTTTYDGQPTALPFHQDYVFRFVQEDGRPSVGRE